MEKLASESAALHNRANRNHNKVPPSTKLHPSPTAEKISRLSSAVSPLLRTFVSSDLGVDSIVNFISVSNQLLNSNTTNAKLDSLTSAFNSLFQSQGFNSYYIFYTLNANMWTIIDAFLNFVRIWEGRFLSWRDRREELTAPDPLDGLLESFSATNNNLDFVSRAIRILACSSNDDDDVIPDECFEPDRADATAFDNAIDTETRPPVPFSLHQYTNLTDTLLPLKARQGTDAEDRTQNHVQQQRLSAEPLPIRSETSLTDSHSDEQHSTTTQYNQRPVGSQPQPSALLSELQTILESTSKALQSYVTKIGAPGSFLKVKGNYLPKRQESRKQESGRQSKFQLSQYLSPPRQMSSQVGSTHRTQIFKSKRNIKTNN